MSKEYRLSKIFRPETGNTLILPVDHGVSAGNIKGLENPVQVLKDLKSSDVDAILMSDGIARQAESEFYGKSSPARIIAADVVYSNDKKIHHDLYTNVETAVKKGYDCIKLIMFWDRPPEEQMQSIQVISSVINEADKWDMPVMVEPLTYNFIEDENKRIEVLTDAARIAYELGTDILKLPHPGETETMASWVRNYNVPIILLGGATDGSVNDIVTQVSTAISFGVRGVAIGRNIWQRPNNEAKQLLSEFAKVIHKDNS